MARRRTVLSAFQVVLTPEELELPLDVDAFAPSTNATPVGRGRSVLLGVAVAAWLVAVAGAVELVADPPEVVRVVAAVLSFLVVGPVLWRFGTLRDDGRLIHLVGGLLVVTTALALPWDVDGLGVHVLLLGLGAALLVQSYLLWAKLQRFLPRHAADRARIAAVLRDAVRASSARLHVSDARAGGGYRVLGGTITYADAAGRERTVPLLTLATVTVLLEPGDEVPPDTPCAVWHAPDHTVVLTRLLGSTAAASA